MAGCSFRLHWPNRLLQAVDDFIYTMAPLGIQLIGRQIGDRLQVTDNSQGLLDGIVDQHQARDHKGAVGIVQWRMTVWYFFNKTDHVIAEKANRAPVKPWKPGKVGGIKRAEQSLQFIKRVTT